MADINLGWLTGFDDVKFAPKTLFSQILNDDNGMTLKDYFFNIINLNKLQVNLASDEAGTFSAEKEDSNTASLIGVTGTLDVGNGGIGVANPTANALLVGNGANPIALLGLPSDGTKQFLISTSAGPAYSKLYGSWTQGDASNGPNLNLGFTSDASDYKGVSGAIPVATATVSGVMSATAQGFGGLKTFADGITVLETTTLSNLVIDGSSANIDMGGNAIAGVASPTDGAHAANKTYVDNIQTTLSQSISDLSDIVGGTSSTGSHHVRLSALEADNTSNIARLDKLDTYFGGYDENTKAFYILDGSAESADDCNVVAYFDEDGLHVTELLVGTDKYTDQISNLQKQDAAIDQSLQAIYTILGEKSVTTKDHYSWLTEHTTQITDILAKNLQVNLGSTSPAAFSTGSFGVTGTLGVGNGGTGRNTLTKHALLVGNDTSEVTLLTQPSGTEDRFLGYAGDSAGPKYLSLYSTWVAGSATAGPSLKIGFSEAASKGFTLEAIPVAAANATGVVTTGAQTFAGAKTFNDAVTAASSLSVSGNLTTSGTFTSKSIIDDGITVTVSKSIAANGGLSLGSSVTVSMGNNIVTNVNTPSADTDAANKSYVDGQIGNINSILGTDNALGTVFEQLSDLTTKYTTENGERVAADEVHSGKLDALEGIVGGALSDGITHQVNLETIFSILGVSTVPAEGEDHNTQLTTLKSSLETAITDLNAAIDTAKADIRDDELVVDFATSGAQAISSGKIGIQGTLAVDSGGTGATTFTANSLLIGNGTDPLKQVSTNKGLLLQNQDGTLSFGGDIKVQWFATASNLDTLINWVSGDGNDQTLVAAASSGSNSGVVASIPMATEGYCGLMSASSQTFGGSKTFSGDVSMSSTLTVGSQLTANGASRFNGTAYFESYIGSGLIPSSSYTMLLGNSGNPWGSVYAKEVILKDASGIGYIKSSTATSTITIQDASVDMTSPILYLNGQKIVLNSNNYGSSLPTEGMVEGQVFFLLTS